MSLRPKPNQESVDRIQSLVEMPRLRRASARSRPNLRSAWAAGKGIEPAFDMHLESLMPDVSLQESDISDASALCDDGAATPQDFYIDSTDTKRETPVIS